MSDADPGGEAAEFVEEPDPQRLTPPLPARRDGAHPSTVGETSEPPRVARTLAVVAIIVGGLCGGLIGWAFVELQCDDCGGWLLVGALAGAVFGAVGVAVVATLGLRAMAEWETIRVQDAAAREARRRRSR